MTDRESLVRRIEVGGDESISLDILREIIEQNCGPLVSLSENMNAVLSSSFVCIFKNQVGVSSADSFSGTTLNGKTIIISKHECPEDNTESTPQPGELKEEPKEEKPETSVAVPSSVGSRLLKSLFKKAKPVVQSDENQPPDTAALTVSSDANVNKTLANRIDLAQYEAKCLLEKQAVIIAELNQIWEKLQSGEYDLRKNPSEDTAMSS